MHTHTNTKGLERRVQGNLDSWGWVWDPVCCYVTQSLFHVWISVTYQRQEQISPNPVSEARAPAVGLPPHFLFTAASSSSFYPIAITITMATRLRLFQQVGKT